MTSRLARTRQSVAETYVRIRQRGHAAWCGFDYDFVCPSMGTYPFQWFWDSCFHAVVLSHLQRGGTPCAYDRRMARNFGICAANLIHSGHTGRMVSFLDGKYTSVPLKEIIGKLTLVDVEREYDTALYNGKRTILPL